MSFFTGSPAQFENVSTLLPYQEKLHRQKVGAAEQALPQLQQYYGNLLGNDSADFQSFAAPQMRQFREDIIPGLAEQFAGMGSGGLSSSGFRNAAVSAGTDLAERLGALRAQLRQSGAAGLQGLASQGTENVSQSVMTDPGSQGLLGMLGPAIGMGIGSFGGPLLGGLGTAAANWITGGNNQQGQRTPVTSPSVQPFKAPNFQTSMRGMQ